MRASVMVAAGEASLRLMYSATARGERRQFDYAVPLSWTPCHYGGTRPWFSCPDCDRRVALLYGGARFVCRHCRRLAYQVQRDAVNDRIIRRADAIRERLGWGAGILNPAGQKPRGMHWTTYYRLTTEYHRLAEAGLAGIMASLRPAHRAMDRAAQMLKSI